MATAPDHGAILKGDRAAHPLGYVQDSDPGAIGADRPWQDTSGSASGYYTPKTRNGDDDGWLTANATHLGGTAAADYAQKSGVSPAFTTLTDGATVTWATAGARVNHARVE